ncbi:uncharacterized protein [Diadema antillarum]|uniref:uncharacterized protein n=1 Tax=Diadema antillarum TaxID=105358 RepID=UPI003A8817E1
MSATRKVVNEAIGTPTNASQESTRVGSAGVTDEKSTSYPAQTEIPRVSSTTTVVSETTPDGIRPSTHSRSTTERTSTVQRTSQETGTPTNASQESTRVGSAGVTDEKSTSYPAQTEIPRVSSTTTVVSETTPDGIRPSTHSRSTTERTSTVQTTSQETGTPTNASQESTRVGSAGVTDEKSTSYPAQTEIPRVSSTTTVVSETTPDGIRPSTHSRSTTERTSTVQTTSQETASSFEITCEREIRSIGRCGTDGKILPLPVNQSYVLDIVNAVRNQCGDHDLIWLGCACCWSWEQISWDWQYFVRDGDWRCWYPPRGNIPLGSVSFFATQFPNNLQDSPSNRRCLAVRVVDGVLQFIALACYNAEGNEQARTVCV